MKKKNSKINVKIEELDLVDLILIFWKRKNIIIFSTLITITLSIFYYYSTPVSYRILAKIPEPDKSSLIKYSALNDLLVKQGVSEYYLIDD